MLVSPEQSARARDAILGVGAWEVESDFQSYIKFAGGDPANNKLSADKPLEEGQPREVRDAVLEPLQALVMGGDGDIQPDTLWGVPSGGQAYAIELAEQRLAGKGLSVVRLKKAINRIGEKTYFPLTDRDAELLEQAKNMVGIEDASTHFTSVRGAMYGSGPPLGALSRKTQRIVTVWHRGPEEATDRLLAPVHSVVKERIPEMISPEDEFYQRFGHLAVRSKRSSMLWL